MKAQAKDCSGPCFAAFAPITNRPGDLRKCFDDKDDILQGFLTCFEQKVEGCVPDRNGPQIPKTNILKLFSIGEHRLVNQSAAMQSIIAPIKHIVNAAGDFAKCIKDCFLAKNANGFCFDRKG
ncbi:hypothetical protein ANCCAN_05864 [Ancylostoma caninum]|uniref:Uncharacterized protein n=1 Tax=Ancylostoma caninum TaxID=29170 RepID=A0A368GWU2_ANCCA|nr:hypothetical protein ANCCAN_05864 [Ancylostoma caninum]